MCRRVIAFLLLCFAAGCQSGPAPPPANSSPAAPQPAGSTSNPVHSPDSSAERVEPNAVKPKLDACALLTAAEIESIQGETVKETKLTGQVSGGLSISQCFFTLPTFNNSISLVVGHKGDGAGSRVPKAFWLNTFHGEKRKDKDGEKRVDEGEEESAPPKRVAGLGDEAFWMGNRIAGALYVLKGDAYLRVSVGGPSNKASQTRARQLAQKAIARL